METQLDTPKKHPLLSLIESKLPDVRAALPPGTIEAERLEVAFRSAFNKNPKLTECSPMSVCAALVNCASLGLVPNTPEQHAYLIPRAHMVGNVYVMECNLEIGYRGFIAMIERSGKVSHVKSGVVMQGDKWDCDLGNGTFTHSPNIEDIERNSRPILAAYCQLAFKDGSLRLEVMDAGSLKKIEAAMMAQNRGTMTPAWKTWREEMHRKPVIKRMAKTCNLSPEVTKAAELDNERFQIVPQLAPKTLVLPAGGEAAVEPRHALVGEEISWEGDK